MRKFIKIVRKYRWTALCFQPKQVKRERVALELQTAITNTMLVVV